MEKYENPRDHTPLTDPPCYSVAPGGGGPSSGYPSATPGGWGQTYPAPLVQQQQPSINTAQANTTVVITNQQSPLNMRPWTSGICSGCMDITSCLCAAFCGACYLCHISDRMGEGCCMPVCIPPNSALAMLRVKLRTQENIHGSISSDYCTTCCCWPCVLCQVKRELDVIRSRRDALHQLKV